MILNKPTFKQRLFMPSPRFFKNGLKICVFVGAMGGYILLANQNNPLPNYLIVIAEIMVGIGAGGAAMAKFTVDPNNLINTNMYTETQRQLAHLPVDNTETESFSWSTDGGLTNTPEIQVVVQDAESPTGIWVYWQETNTTNNLADFIAASFPRKPIKRGGIPPSV